MKVIIAGGGIAGLSMALTCHEIGVPAIVLESADTISSSGVGINLQPNAVRELFDMGIAERQLDEIGVQTREWALLGRNGKEIWTEPRGRLAGYHWPQYSVHRGQLQLLLYRIVCERLGSVAIRTGHRVVDFHSGPAAVTVQVDRSDGSRYEVQGDLLLATDGINSAIRERMYPDQGEPRWSGTLMWLGTSPGKPIRTGASFVGIGSLLHRFVCFPISAPAPDTGLATINWIAEMTVDPHEVCARSDWNRAVDVDTLLPHFKDWNFGWLDVPAMMRAATSVLEYPMVDRDPVPSWVDGRVALLGDAAHPMYPVGSNGASQAIVDARVLGAAMLRHGVTRAALLDYEARLREPLSALVVRTREAGPFGMLGIVGNRCGGVFDEIDEVIPHADVEQYMTGYKAAAGFAIDSLNALAPTIAAGARCSLAPGREPN